jgi:tetratricopeptide (TPR) repeat protein
MRIVPAAIAAFFLCAGAAAANPAVATTDNNPCQASAGRPFSERMIACNETIASQTSLAIHIDACMERARLYMNSGDWRRALADYAEVVQRDPKYAAVYAALAEARAYSGNIAGAIEEYGRALALEPATGDFWAGRCWMRARLGRDLNDALDDCQHGLLLQPNAYQMFGARAFAYLARSDYQLAIADFDTELGLAASEAKARAYALYGRGLAKLRSGNRDSGRSDLTSAQLLDPTIADQFRSWGFSS